MSIASLNQFQNDVMQDSALQEQFKTAAATSPESLGELSDSTNLPEEVLSEQDLETVAGGVIFYPIVALIKAIDKANKTPFDKLPSVIGGPLEVIDNIVQRF
ncbi:Nif11 family protein [Microcoleus sp. herbarium19]